MHFVEDLENVKNNVKAHFNEDGTLYIEGDLIKTAPYFLRTSATIKNPAEFTAKVFKQIMVKENLMNENARILPFGDFKYGNLIYEHQSAPLKDIIFNMLKFSKNNYAETLVRTLGKEVKGEGTQIKGVAVLEELFQEIGIDPNEIAAFDGSGMSVNTRASSNDFIRLFDYINKQSWKDLFWNSLPQSNVDGTLKSRFKSVELIKEVIAKTGTHLNASSLSGKIVNENGKDILFSVHIFNHPFTTEESAVKVNPVIDRIVMMIGRQF